MRILLPDGTTASAPDVIAINTLHTLTTTYDNGDLRLYLDGAEVADASTFGNVDLGGFPLFIGEDAGGDVDHDLIGTLDDAFVLSRALTPAEVLQVHQQGAAVLLPEPAGSGALMAGLALLLLLRRGGMRPRRWALRSQRPGSRSTTFQ